MYIVHYVQLYVTSVLLLKMTYIRSHRSQSQYYNSLQWVKLYTQRNIIESFLTFIRVVIAVV